jgi:FKBP-type peptidyl-prolyl cis-trans isomerase
MKRCGLIFLFPILVGCTEPAPPGANLKVESRNTSHISDSPHKTEPGPVDNDAPEEFTTTASGLKYRIRRNTEFPKPGPNNLVRVHYRGELESGEVFGSSYDDGKVLLSNVSEFIDGWKEGMLLVPEGGMIEMIIPPELGYGEYGKRAENGKGIPPNATLKFLVELIKIETHPYQP